MDFEDFENFGGIVQPGDVKAANPLNAEPMPGMGLFQAGSISAIEIVDANTIKVTFSKAVDFSTVDRPEHWSIVGTTGNHPQVHEVLNSVAVTYYKYKSAGPNSVFYSTSASLGAESPWWTLVETIPSATTVALNLYSTLVIGETYDVTAPSAAHWNGKKLVAS